MRSGTAQAIVPVCARCAHAGRRVWNACWRRLRLGVTHPSSITGDHTNAHTHTHRHTTHTQDPHTQTPTPTRAHTQTPTHARASSAPCLSQTLKAVHARPAARALARRRPALGVALGPLAPARGGCPRTAASDRRLRSDWTRFGRCSEVVRTRRGTAGVQRCDAMRAECLGHGTGPLRCRRSRSGSPRRTCAAFSPTWSEAARCGGAARGAARGAALSTRL